MRITIQDLAFHRNGVSGEGFHAVNFYCHASQRHMTAFVFMKDYDEETQAYILDGNPKVAVIDRDLLGQGIITFGINSWRGDYYANDLLVAINHNNKN